MENNSSVPQKIKNRIPCDPSIPLMVIYSKELKDSIQKDICIPMIRGTSFTVDKRWKSPKCPSMNK